MGFLGYPRLDARDPPESVLSQPLIWRIPVEVEPSRMCELLVDLGDVDVVGVDDVEGEPLRVHVRCRAPRPVCEGCGGVLWSYGERLVELVDLCSYGKPRRLVWHKRVWRCPSGDCEVGCVSEQNAEIAPPREKLTSRAGRWATFQVGRRGRPVTDLVKELECCWHTVNDAVQRWGQALLDADTDRIAKTDALGLDEHLMWRKGRFRNKTWATGIVDVRHGQLLDLVEGRNVEAPTQWLMQQRSEWREQICWVTLDLSATYRRVFDQVLPHAVQVADRFHVIRLANAVVDKTRRRVQNETLGHRGRKNDPLHRVRKLLLLASSRIDNNNYTKLTGLLDAGDPNGEVRDAWRAKEVLQGIYDINDPILAADWLNQLIDDLKDPDLPFELNQLGRTLSRWSPQIINWHIAHITNAASEAANNLIKRVKRVAFGFTNFANYRIRALLYAGKPNWALLNTLTVT